MTKKEYIQAKRFADCRTDALLDLKAEYIQASAKFEVGQKVKNGAGATRFVSMVFVSFDGSIRYRLTKHSEHVGNISEMMIASYGENELTKIND